MEFINRNEKPACTEGQEKQIEALADWVHRLTIQIKVRTYREEPHALLNLWRAGLMAAAAAIDAMDQEWG